MIIAFLITTLILFSFNLLLNIAQTATFIQRSEKMPMYLAVVLVASILIVCWNIAVLVVAI